MKCYSIYYTVKYFILLVYGHWYHTAKQISLHLSLSSTAILHGISGSMLPASFFTQSLIFDYLLTIYWHNCISYILYCKKFIILLFYYLLLQSCNYTFKINIKHFVNQCVSGRNRDTSIWDKIRLPGFGPQSGNSGLPNVSVAFLGVSYRPGYLRLLFRLWIPLFAMHVLPKSISVS
jgi:hypothetical protein